MSSVWIVTEGDYSDNHIVGVFSTKEKADEYYKLHSGLSTHSSYYEPEEYIVDAINVCPQTCQITATKRNGELVFRTKECFDDNNSIGRVTLYNGYYYIIVSYNPDETIMFKSAQDYLFKYLAEKEGL